MDVNFISALPAYRPTDRWAAIGGGAVSDNQSDYHRKQLTPHPGQSMALFYGPPAARPDPLPFPNKLRREPSILGAGCVRSGPRRRRNDAQPSVYRAWVQGQAA